MGGLIHLTDLWCRLSMGPPHKLQGIFRLGLGSHTLSLYHILSVQESQEPSLHSHAGEIDSAWSEESQVTLQGKLIQESIIRWSHYCSNLS